MTALRTRIRRLLRPRKVALPLPEDFEGADRLLLLTGRGRDQIAMEVAAGGWHSFERPLPALIAAAVQQVEGSFIDVGANTGFYALLAACASRATTVHAFEPYPPVLETLRRNISLNRLEDRITICPYALGSSAGRQPLYVPLQDHGLVESSASLNAGFKPEHSDVIEIDVTTLDAYVAGLPSARVGLLKVDVESTEHQVIAGGSSTIARDRPLIVLEVLHLADHRRLGAFCADNDYIPFTLHHDRIERRPDVRFHGDAWNQCFCPEERRPLLQACAAGAGLLFSA